MPLLRRKRDDEPVDMNERLAQEAEASGYAAAIREPLPDFPDQWRVICEVHAITSSDFVRDADDFVQGLADRHGAEYDGWEASL